MSCAPWVVFAPPLPLATGVPLERDFHPSTAVPMTHIGMVK
jgi:hypothetical protein